MKRCFRMLALPALCACMLALTGCGPETINLPAGTERIEDEAWMNHRSIRSAVIPEGVKVIGKRAFKGCTGLTEVTIPASMDEIGQDAFEGCKALAAVTLPGELAAGQALRNCDSEKLEVTLTGSEVAKRACDRCEGITSVVIADGVTKIGSEAFKDCVNLTSVVIPPSVTEIGESAFKDCGKLASLEIPDSVTVIGDWAFSGCRSLVSLRLPSSPEKIGQDVFGSSAALASVEIPDSWKSIPDGMFRSSGLESVTFPSSLLSIGDSAFAGCKSLTSVTLPPSLEIIGSGAFGYCSGLTGVTIPGSVTMICRSAFSHCTGLESVGIPDSVTSISYDAFSDCTSLTSVVIPESVTSLGETVFSGCDALREMTIPGNLLRGKLQLEKGTVHITGDRIANEGLADSPGIRKVEIADTVKDIGDFAFKNCTGLNSIVVPDSVTHIGTCAFQGANLNYLSLPSSVTFESGSLEGTPYMEYKENFLERLPENIYEASVEFPVRQLPQGIEVVPLETEQWVLSGIDTEMYQLLPEKIRTYDTRSADYALIRRTGYPARSDYTSPAHDTVTEVFLCPRKGDPVLLTRFIHVPPVSGTTYNGGSLGPDTATTGEEIWDAIKRLFPEEKTGE